MRRQVVLYLVGYAALIALILLIAATGGYAQRPDLGKETPKAMSELDALKIGKLFAERQVYEQALLKLQAQQESLRAQTQLTRLEYDAVTTHLQTAIVAAASSAGLTADDLKAGWQPAPERREWVKTSPGKD